MKKLIVAAALALAATGCVFKGAKVTEGTDLSIGLSVPGTDGVAQLSILNYLSGFRLGVAKDAQLWLNYTVAETNSYFGIVETRSMKRIKAKVVPCEDAPDDGEADAQDVVPDGEIEDVMRDDEPDESGGDAQGTAELQKS